MKHHAIALTASLAVLACDAKREQPAPEVAPQTYQTAPRGVEPAAASPSPSPSPSVKQPASPSVKQPARTPTRSAGAADLDSLLPGEMAGMKRVSMGGMKSPPGHAHAAFMEGRRSININVQTVKESPEAIKNHAARLLKPGESRENPAAQLSLKGFEVDGFVVERTYYTSGSKQSQASVRFRGKLDLDLTVQPASDKDEAIELIKTLGLNRFDAYAGTL